MTEARQRLAALRAEFTARSTLPLNHPTKAPQKSIKQVFEPTPTPAPAPPLAKPSKLEMQQHRDRVNAAHADYIHHHWNCPTCIAAGQRRGDRCNIGLAIWESYSDIAGR